MVRVKFLDLAHVRRGFSLLVLSRPCPEGFRPCPQDKNQYYKLQFDLKTVDRKSHWWDVSFILNNRTGAYSRKSGIWIRFKVVSIREMKATVRRKF